MDPVLCQKIKDLQSTFLQQKAEYETQLKEYSKDTYYVEKTYNHIQGERVHICSYLQKRPIDMRTDYILIDAIKELIAKINADEGPIKRYTIYEDTRGSSRGYDSQDVQVTKLPTYYEIIFNYGNTEYYSISKKNILKILNDILEMPMPPRNR